MATILSRPQCVKGSSATVTVNHKDCAQYGNREDQEKYPQT